MKVIKNNSAKTVLIISVGFGIVFLLSDFRWVLYTSLIVGVLGILSDKICNFIDFLWMKLTKILSFIIPNILLSVVFYLFLFPISVLSKVFDGKNLLQLKNNNETVWVIKKTKLDKTSFEKMW